MAIQGYEELDATALAALVRKKELHPRELVEEVISRIEAVDRGRGRPGRPGGPGLTTDAHSTEPPSITEAAIPAWLELQWALRLLEHGGRPGKDIRNRRVRLVRPGFVEAASQPYAHSRASL